MTIRVLTPTEVRVAQLVSAGRSNRQVAEELGLTLKTVEWHVSRVYRKLGARSRTELSVLLLRSEARDGDAKEVVEEVLRPTQLEFGRVTEAVEPSHVNEA